MKCSEILDKLVESGNGYLLTSQVEQSGVSRTTLAEYVKERIKEIVQTYTKGKDTSKLRIVVKRS